MGDTIENPLKPLNTTLPRSSRTFQRGPFISSQIILRETAVSRTALTSVELPKPYPRGRKGRGGCPLCYSRGLAYSIWRDDLRNGALNWGRSRFSRANDIHNEKKKMRKILR